MSGLLTLKTIYFERRGKRINDRGVLKPRASTKTTMPGNLQPERNLALVREAFGSHVEGAIKVYSEARFHTKTDEGDADVILWDDREWEVAESRKYDDIIPHYKTIAILKKGER
jgi:hypothetical protein